MKKVTLGRTGLKVSRVGIGGIPIQRPPINEAVKVINRALDLGVNLIDTSIGYGDSELRIGQALKGRHVRRHAHRGRRRLPHWGSEWGRSGE